MLFLISISVNSSNISIASSDESHVHAIFKNTFWVAINVSPAFETRWIYLYWLIIFCLRYAPCQERFQLPQVMIFPPRTQVNVFCMMNMSRVYYCPQFVLFNYLTNITESLFNDTSLIETSLEQCYVQKWVLLSHISNLWIFGSWDK